MAKSLHSDSLIEAIADSIRAKTGENARMTTAQMKQKIDALHVPVTTELSVSENGTYLPASGVDGFFKVEVDVPDSGPQAVLGEKTITQNGTYTAEGDNLDGFSRVVVSVGVPMGRCPRAEQSTLYQFIAASDAISWSSAISFA